MEQQEKKSDKPKASFKKKLLLVSTGLLTTGLLSYFGWQYWKKKKEDTNVDAGNDENSSQNESPSEPVPPLKPIANDGFPLKKGSKGANVKLFQQSLIAKYGKSIMPKYGADGDFGSEMVAALKKVGLPETIDETTFNVFVKGSSPDPANVAQQFYDALNKQDLNTTLNLLKKLRNPADYKAVSDKFTELRLKGTRQTLVNGLMSSFPDDRIKQMISLQLTKIGLKYDGNKWSLSGFDGVRQIITICPSKVWRTPNECVDVPAKMVLGTHIAKRGGYILFENDNQHFIVPSKHVEQYNQ